MKTVFTLILLLHIFRSVISQTVSPDVIISSGEVIESEAYREQIKTKLN